MFRMRGEKGEGGCHGRRFAREEFGFRGGFFRRHGGGRSGRMFEQGDLRFVILHLLSEKPRHGYEVIKALEEQFSGMYSPSPGVIYPTLTLLEELGYASASAEEGGKKRYAITPEGTAFLAANQSMLDQVLGRLAEATRAFAGGTAPEVRRAVHNLRHALVLRLGKGALKPEQVQRITEILDNAAQAIERS